MGQALWRWLQVGGPVRGRRVIHQQQAGQPDESRQAEARDGGQQGGLRCAPSTRRTTPTSSSSSSMARTASSSASGFAPSHRRSKGASRSRSQARPRRKRSAPLFKTLEQLADKKDHHRARPQGCPERARREHTRRAPANGGVLRDDGSASGLQKAMVKAMVDDMMSLVYRFLDAPRKSGVDDASIVQPAATLYKASRPKGTCVIATRPKGWCVLADGKQASIVLGSGRRSKCMNRRRTSGMAPSRPRRLPDALGPRSKTSTVGVRNQMEKERMDLNTLCQAVRL